MGGFLSYLFGWRALSEPGGGGGHSRKCLPGQDEPQTPDGRLGAAPGMEG